MSLTLLLLIGPAHVAHVAMRRPVVLRSVAVAMTEPVGTAEGAPVSPAPAVSEPAPKAAEAPKAAAAPAPQAMRPMPAQAVSRVPSKPTVPFGNGKRPRAEWDKPANYGRYSQMKQAYFSTLLPKTLRVPFVDFEIPVPTFKRPPLLDGTHAGDMGFDPLGLAKDVPTLQTYLEAELKHGRLAMLAVAGWVAAELLAESGLAPGGRAPSLLNGGLFRLQNFLCTGLIFALFSMLEEGREPKSSASMYKDGPGLYDWQHFLDGPYVPGCYNFDPLGLYGLIGADASGRKGMRELETAHGRFAMVAISVWAFLEPMTQKPVTKTFAFFFKPFWVVLGDIFNGLVSTGK